MIIFLFCISYRGEYEKKIQITFLEINFGGKKLPEVTLYTRTAFTSVIWVNVGVFPWNLVDLFRLINFCVETYFVIYTQREMNFWNFFIQSDICSLFGKNQFLDNDSLL